MNVIIGTVQWGLKYGISNTHGITSEQEIASILQLANNYRISYLDTAEQYGISEQKIGKLSYNKFQIISKGKDFNKSETINIKLKRSLKKLGKETLYGYLFHDADELIKKPGLWDEALHQKKIKKLKKLDFQYIVFNNSKT